MPETNSRQLARVSSRWVAGKRPGVALAAPDRAVLERAAIGIDLVGATLPGVAVRAEDHRVAAEVATGLGDQIDRRVVVGPNVGFDADVREVPGRGRRELVQAQFVQRPVVREQGENRQGDGALAPAIADVDGGVFALQIEDLEGPVRAPRIFPVTVHEVRDFDAIDQRHRLILGRGLFGGEGGRVLAQQQRGGFRGGQRFLGRQKVGDFVRGVVGHLDGGKG